MGIFDFLKKKQSAEPMPSNMNYAVTPNVYMPLFSQYGDDIFVSDVVQQAVSCIAGEMRKLKPQHVAKRDGEEIAVNSDVQNVLDNPNPTMGSADFLEKITWLLYLNYNAFIIPQWDSNGRLLALYPIKPSTVTFLQDKSGALFVKFDFPNLYTATLRYDDVIHIRYRYSVNDLMGGNVNGQPDNDALLKTLELNDTMLKGVAKAMNASYAVNGIVKYNSILDNGRTEAALKEITDRLANDQSGFLPLDLKAEFVPLKREVSMVDEATLKFIDEKILRHFGVPISILSGDFSKDEYESFFSKSLEPLIITYSQAFTKTLFSKRASYGFGNKVVFYSEDLIFMTMSQKLEMVRLLGDSGALYENEKRRIFGMKPLAELNGVRLQSLNYVDVKLAAQYQTGNKENNTAYKSDNDLSESDKNGKETQ